MMTRNELLEDLRAAGWGHDGQYDALLQRACREGMSLADARAAVREAGKYVAAVADDSYRAASDGGAARRLAAESDARHQEWKDRKREKDIATMREQLGSDAPRTTLRRITADDPSVFGEQYLGREGEWAEMPTD